MHIIKIYGSGCATCHKLKVLVENIVKQNDISADIQYINDFVEMAQLGILSTPAIIINGKLMSSGTIPKRDEILKWLGTQKN